MAENQCYSFQETQSCRFGDRCRFSHGAGHPGVAREPRAERQPRAPRAERAERPARDANAAPRDNSCYNFASNGSCKFGDSCRFTHGGVANSNASSAPSAAAAGGAERRPRTRNNAPRAPKSQACFAWNESHTCQYGEECRFAHGESDNRDLAKLKRRAAGVCYNWKEGGECKFGEGCRFAHEDIPEGARGAEKEKA